MLVFFFLSSTCPLGRLSDSYLPGVLVNTCSTSLPTGGGFQMNQQITKHHDTIWDKPFSKLAYLLLDPLFLLKIKHSTHQKHSSCPGPIQKHWLRKRRLEGILEMIVLLATSACQFAEPASLIPLHYDVTPCILLCMDEVIDESGNLTEVGVDKEGL
ncbi:putative signal peptide protein [Puccinia sorghi]|uniref:Putative signal peptide protein n=1 Tax=Puccinia sorghi TaxID=27349 RepID=A0A0L6UPV3_9BASI|nr:putative signal peptide protein [Puccinia sorghi]